MAEYLPLQYAFMFNTIFVTFTYGLALPILFIITFLTIINVYICQTILFAYYYKKPPIYGEGMNDAALSILTYAPCFMICLSYWFLGNRQTFFNESNLKDISSEEYDPGHSLFDYSKGLNHTALFLVYLPIFIFFRQWFNLLRYIAQLLKLINPIEGITLGMKINVQVDEFLGSYWTNLTGISQMQTYV